MVVVIALAHRDDGKCGPASRSALRRAPPGQRGIRSGSLDASSQPDLIRWQSAAFTAPFDLDLKSVTAIHYSVPAELPKPRGEYCFELAGGDVLFGSLLAMNDKEADLEIVRLGRLHVNRSVINRMYRWRSSSDLIYLGPNGLAGWQQAANKSGWKEEQGQPWTDQDGATIRGDFKLPARSTIEFELSWKNKPDFVFALGVGEDEKSVQREVPVRGLGTRSHYPARDRSGSRRGIGG